MRLITDKFKKRLIELWLKNWDTDKPGISKEPMDDALHVREVNEVTDKDIDKAVSKVFPWNLQMAWKAGARWMRRIKDGK